MDKEMTQTKLNDIREFFTKEQWLLYNFIAFIILTLTSIPNTVFLFTSDRERLLSSSQFTALNALFHVKELSEFFRLIAYLRPFFLYINLVILLLFVIGLAFMLFDTKTGSIFIYATNIIIMITLPFHIFSYMADDRSFLGQFITLKGADRFTFLLPLTMIILFCLLIIVKGLWSDNLYFRGHYDEYYTADCSDLILFPYVVCSIAFLIFGTEKHLHFEWDFYQNYHKISYGYVIFTLILTAISLLLVYRYHHWFKAKEKSGQLSKEDRDKIDIRISILLFITCFCILIGFQVIGFFSLTGLIASLIIHWANLHLALKIVFCILLVIAFFLTVLFTLMQLYMSSEYTGKFFISLPVYLRDKRKRSMDTVTRKTGRKTGNTSNSKKHAKRKSKDENDEKTTNIHRFIREYGFLTGCWISFFMLALSFIPHMITAYTTDQTLLLPTVQFDTLGKLFHVSRLDDFFGYMSLLRPLFFYISLAILLILAISLITLYFRYDQGEILVGITSFFMAIYLPFDIFSYMSADQDSFLASFFSLNGADSFTFLIPLILFILLCSFGIAKYMPDSMITLSLTKRDGEFEDDSGLQSIQIIYAVCITAYLIIGRFVWFSFTTPYLQAFHQFTDGFNFFTLILTVSVWILIAIYNRWYVTKGKEKYAKLPKEEPDKIDIAFSILFLIEVITAFISVVCTLFFVILPSAASLIIHWSGIHIIWRIVFCLLLVIAFLITAALIALYIVYVSGYTGKCFISIPAYLRAKRIEPEDTVRTKVLPQTDKDEAYEKEKQAQVNAQVETLRKDLVELNIQNSTLKIRVEDLIALNRTLKNSVADLEDQVETLTKQAKNNQKQAHSNETRRKNQIEGLKSQLAALEEEASLKESQYQSTIHDLNQLVESLTKDLQSAIDNPVYIRISSVDLGYRSLTPVSGEDIKKLL